MEKLKKEIEESKKKLLESGKTVTPESMIQEIATHLGKTIPETLEHIKKFNEDLDNLKAKE